MCSEKCVQRYSVYLSVDPGYCIDCVSFVCLPCVCERGEAEERGGIEIRRDEGGAERGGVRRRMITRKV